MAPEASAVLSDGAPAEPGDLAFERSDGEARAAADGVTVDESLEIDFFGTDERHTFYLPGTNNRQWFEFRELREGELKQFQKLVNRDVIMQRTTGDTKMRIDPAEERHALIKSSLTGWQLYRRSVKQGNQMVAVPYDTRELNSILELFPAKIIADLEKAIREANPMLRAEQTVEEIDEAIENLQRQREEAVKRQGKSDA